MKLVIDLEGDALNKFYNRQVFPNGNHFDPDTRIWCCSIYGGNDNLVTYCCKLPSTTRTLPRPYHYIDKKTGKYEECWNTTTKHLESTIIPKKLNEYNITAIDNYEDFLNRINVALEMAKEYNATVYFKGFGLKHDYDYELLKVNFNKYNITTSNLSVLRNAYKDFTIPTWTPTTAQVQRGKFVENQEYLERGIIHNIEDVQELWEIVK